MVEQLIHYCIVFLLTQRREERIQSQMSNPHYLKPSSSSAKSSQGAAAGDSSFGLSESSGLTAGVDTSKIPIQKLELGIGLVLGKSCDCQHRVT